MLRSLSGEVCPLITYRRTGQGRQRSTGALHDLLMRPAPATSQAGLVGALVGSLATVGNGYLGKFRDLEGRVAQLAVIAPDHVSVRLVDGEPVYTLITERGASEHSSADVIHVRGALSVDGLRGVSPIGLARESLGLAAALVETSAALFGNQAIPKGILTVPAGDAEDDTLENLRHGFSVRHGGPQNAGRVAVVTSDVKFSSVSLSPADAELLAMRKLSATEIARLFRVPPHLIGAEDGGGLQYTNTEQSGADFLRFSLAPHLTAVEQAISNDPDLSAPGEYCEFLVDAFLRADTLARYQAYEVGVRSGFLLPDDVRQRENLPPLPTAPPTAALNPPTES